MRASTILWAKFESVGYPKATKTIQGTIPELIKAQAEWLLGVSLTSVIDIRFAKTEEDLSRRRKGEPDTNGLPDFESLFADLGNGTDDEEVN